MFDGFFNFDTRSNVERIDDAREFIANEMGPEMFTKKRDVEAIRLLRENVPGLSLVDAATLIRRKQAENGEV